MDIEDLYALLPDMQCLPGCTECCRSFGVPSRTRVEDERLRQYLRDQGRVLEQARDTSCPYVSAAGCTVYPVRPLTCRVYGVSASYLCKLGARPLDLLHPDEEEEIFHLYQKHFF